MWGRGGTMAGGAADLLVHLVAALQVARRRAFVHGGAGGLDGDVLLPCIAGVVHGRRRDVHSDVAVVRGLRRAADDARLAVVAVQPRTHLLRCGAATECSQR